MSSVPTQRPAVTVALPVYNGARFVHRAISSVVAQQGWDVNIVAVDDGSTDDSADVLAALAAHDARIEVITFDRNRGVAAARNAAMAHRDDPLVAMIDQDDTGYPGGLMPVLCPPPAAAQTPEEAAQCATPAAQCSQQARSSAESRKGQPALPPTPTVKRQQGRFRPA